MNESTQVFEQFRSRLFRLAYGMLSSVADAEDIVQEAFIKWVDVDHEKVRSDWAFLSTMVSRLCLDELRSARKCREEYVGPWLPEPLIATTQTPEYLVERSEDLSMAMMVMLESLTPVQRAVYVLHDLFSFNFREISELIGKDEANCRKIAQRARSFIDSQGERRLPVGPEQEKFLSSFIKAVELGEVSQLKEMLAKDAILYSDGGGKVNAARKPIFGNDKIGRFLVSVAEKATGKRRLQIRNINGRPGIVTWLNGELYSIWSFSISSGHIRNIYIILNPDKLSHIARQIS